MSVIILIKSCLFCKCVFFLSFNLWSLGGSIIEVYYNNARAGPVRTLPCAHCAVCTGSHFYKTFFFSLPELIWFASSCLTVYFITPILAVPLSVAQWNFWDTVPFRAFIKPRWTGVLPPVTLALILVRLILAIVVRITHEIFINTFPVITLEIIQRAVIGLLAVGFIFVVWTVFMVVATHFSGYAGVRFVAEKLRWVARYLCETCVFVMAQSHAGGTGTDFVLQ